jgi:PIN domain nuclease of toxin-antitoxin system
VTGVSHVLTPKLKPNRSPNMTTPAPTPITDAAIDARENGNVSIVELYETARKLERDRAALIADAQALVEWALKMNRVPRPGSPVERMRATLAAVQS